MSAAEAVRALELAMARRPSGSGALKAALAKAEAAASALSGAGGTFGGADLVLPLIQVGPGSDAMRGASVIDLPCHANVQLLAVLFCTMTNPCCHLLPMHAPGTIW